MCDTAPIEDTAMPPPSKKKKKSLIRTTTKAVVTIKKPLSPQELLDKKNLKISRSMATKAANKAAKAAHAAAASGVTVDPGSSSQTSEDICEDATDDLET